MYNVPDKAQVVRLSNTQINIIVGVSTVFYMNIIALQGIICQRKYGYGFTGFYQYAC